MPPRNTLPGVSRSHLERSTSKIARAPPHTSRGHATPPFGRTGNLALMPTDTWSWVCPASCVCLYLPSPPPTSLPGWGLSSPFALTVVTASPPGSANAHRPAPARRPRRESRRFRERVRTALPRPPSVLPTESLAPGCSPSEAKLCLLWAPARLSRPLGDRADSKDVDFPSVCATSLPLTASARTTPKRDLFPFGPEILSDVCLTVRDTKCQPLGCPGPAPEGLSGGLPLHTD